MRLAEQRIAAWLTDYLGSLFGIAPARIDARKTFQQYGLDSSAAVSLSGELAEWIGCNVDPAAAYEHPSVAQLARALAEDRNVQVALQRRAH